MQITNNQITIPATTQTSEAEEGPGYKKTKIGWIPEEWSVTKLKDVATIQTGIQKGASRTGNNFVELPYLRVANVQDGHLDLTTIKTIKVPSDKVSRYLLQNNDVLMTEGGDFDKLGRGTIWKNEIPNCVHQNHVFAVRCNKSLIHPYYLSSYSSSSKGKDYFVRCSKQTTNLASINSSQLKELPIILPSISEQLKIVKIISTWDKAIEHRQNLILQLKQRKKGLMQELLTGKTRLKGYSGEWKKVKGADLFTSRNEKGINNGEIPLYSLTIEDGVTPKSDRYIREFLVKDVNKKYKVIRPDDIAFNPANLRWGAIARHKGLYPVLLSPIYEVLKTKKGNDIDFITCLVSSPRQIAIYCTLIEGSLVERMAVKLDAFLSCQFKMPPKEEQTAIAQILTAADNEIKKQQNYLAQLQAQKKGLMQQLLTGQKRVKV
tara:strand:- start:14228 stop:15529 length:1302 start_codon:yes stop_codon:yes gene_type:complete